MHFGGPVQSTDLFYVHSKGEGIEQGGWHNVLITQAITKAMAGKQYYNRIAHCKTLPPSTTKI